MFKTVDHQADIAVELTASDRHAFFRSALDALVFLLTNPNSQDDSALLTSDKKTASARLVQNIQKQNFSVNGFDDEELLVRLMNEFLFLCQVEKHYPIEIASVKSIATNELVVIFSYLPISNDNQLAREIKAATYNNLKIERHPQWHARVVLDV